MTEVLYVACVIVGLLLGYGIRSFFAKRQYDSIEKQARAKLESADAEVSRKLREADIQARMEVVQAREQFEASAKVRQAALQEKDDRLSAREENIERKLHILEEKERSIKATEESQDNTARELASREDMIEKREAESLARMQKVAGMTIEEAKVSLRNKVKDAVKAECGAFYRRRYEEAKNEADRKAADLIAYAVRRYAAGHAGESMTSRVSLPNTEIKGRIIGRDGRNVRTIEAATGVTLLVDGMPDSVVVSCFNPIRREIARQALVSLIADGRIHPASIETAVAKAKENLEETMFQVGKETAYQLKLEGFPREILIAIGRLQFRLSFSQNVLEHSIEVARLMGSMADELKLDGQLARRIGLLHDIGKGLTDEVEGGHAKIGADLLSKYGEDPILINAVASHHEEVEPNSVYAVLCSAADAISSARPGARNESTELYYERIERLEEIAKSHQGVNTAFAIQAGHELRVVIDPDVLSDNDAMILAHDISSDIEANLKYPGQIRVVIIREKRCIEYAR